MPICYLVFLSSGLDSTAAFLNVLNEKATSEDLIIPIYIWWRTDFTKVIARELNNVEQILTYVRNKYKDKKLDIKNVFKIDIPLLFYENIRKDFINEKRKDYFCYFRNAIFILGGLSFILNYFKLFGIKNYSTITIVTGFIGGEADENSIFTENISPVINKYIENTRLIDMIDNIDFYSPYINTIEDNISQQYMDIYNYGDWEILKYTWSCWKDDVKPCCNCPGCFSRKGKLENFKKPESTLKDPIMEV